LALKFKEYITGSGAESCSNSELEDIYESDDDEETPVVEYDWDKLFAQGKKGPDESKLVRYVLPGDEEKLEDRLADVEASWPDYQQELLTPVNSPEGATTMSIHQSFTDANGDVSSSLEQNVAVDSTTLATSTNESTTITDSTTVSSAVSSMAANEVPSTITTNSCNMASSLVSKTDSSYGSMQSRTQEILSQRSNAAVITSQPSRESMGTQDDWNQLFAQEPGGTDPSLPTDQPPPYSPPRSNSLVAGMNCPASSGEQPRRKLHGLAAIAAGERGDPLTNEPITPPQPPMAIIARRPSFDHGPRRSLLRDPRSKRFFCQVCVQQIDSQVRSRPKLIAWVTGCVLCLIGALGIARCDYGCCLLPCCFDPCLIITHSCPYCDSEVVEDDGRLT